MPQNTLTVLSDIIPAELQKLTVLLGNIGRNVKKNNFIVLNKSDKTHFARFVILSDPKRPRLYFSAVFDGEIDLYIEELILLFGTGVNTIWGHCIGYKPPTPPNSSNNAFKRYFNSYLLERNTPPNLFYINRPDISLKDVRNAAKLREVVDRIFVGKSTLSDLENAVTLAEEISKSTIDPNIVLPPPASNRRFGCKEKIIEYLVGIKENPDDNELMIADDSLLEAEDIVVQNQMTVIVPIKSWWSRLLLRFFLWRGNASSKMPEATMTRVGTIHFAKWVIIDNGRNLLFDSNYDGSWERYIDDFADEAVFEMNAIWGNCEKFPPGGARNVEGFKKSIRENQIPAQVFYSGYPDLTVRNIRNDLSIGKTFSEFVTKPEVERFLRGVYI